MDFKILNWNIGGAKFLETKTANERAELRKRVNGALKILVEGSNLASCPDIITLQEIVRYKEPDGKGTPKEVNSESQKTGRLSTGIPRCGFWQVTSTLRKHPKSTNSSNE